MNLVDRISHRRSNGSPWPTLTFDQLPAWMGQFGYQGLGYGPTVIQTMQQNRETIAADFTGYVNGAYKTNGAVFAVCLTRMLLFSEATFQFRQRNNGRAGNRLFGTQALDVLERPWPNGTTGDLLMRAINDVDLAGNFYATRVVDKFSPTGSRIARLRPDWVTIVLGSTSQLDLNMWDPTAELIGYAYTPGGPGSGLPPKFYGPEEVAHWAPIPDPVALYRGMSWLQPVLTEILGDRSMNTHKLMYFENGASPNLVVSMDTGKMNRKDFKEWVSTFENEHAGSNNAYKTLYLGSGANATVVGSNLKDLDYAVNQGHGETRIAAAGGVPPIIVGFSEGLEAATYSNFAQARRAFADKTLRPLWRNAASSLSVLIDVPGGSQLWYDDRDIPFLAADAADGADIQLTKATAMRLLVDAGYEPDSVVAAVEADDFTLLKHSGLYSVQLQAPGTSQAVASEEGWKPTGTPPAPASGSGQGGPGGSSGGGTGKGSSGPSGTGSGGGQLPAKTSSGKRGNVLADLVGNVPALAQALMAAKAGQISERRGRTNGNL